MEMCDYIITDWKCSKCGHNKIDTTRNDDHSFTSKCNKCGKLLEGEQTNERKTIYS